MKKHLLFLSVLVVISSSAYADKYLRSGYSSGAQNGTSWTNAYNGDTAANWDTAFDAISSGENVYVGEGTYPSTGTFSSSLITGASTGIDYRKVIGAAVGTTTPLTGASRPVITGNWVKTAPTSGPTFFVGADNSSYFWFESLIITNFKGGIQTTTTGRVSHLTIKNVDILEGRQPILWYGDDECQNGAAGGAGCPNTADDSTDLNFDHLTITNFTKTGVDFRRGVNDLVADYLIVDAGGSSYNGSDCTKAGRYETDGSYQTGMAIGAGTGGDGDSPDRDMVFTNSEFKNSHNCRVTGGAGEYTAGELYWQGDGFASEGNSTGLVFTNSKFLDNTDGGVDIKGGGTFTDCIWARNKRNIRIWPATPAPTFTNCLSHNAQRYTGNTNSVNHVHFKGDATFNYCTFHNVMGSESVDGRIFESEDDGSDDPDAVLTLNNSIYSVDNNSTHQDDGNDMTYFEASHSISLNSTVYWNGKTGQLSGTDPGYSNPTTAFNGDGTNYNNSLYGETKGYFYEEAAEAIASFVGAILSGVKIS